jgi:shikimate dehydrogenase
MIDGQTRLVGLLGWPVAHSLSPAMHNAAFDALDLNWRYVPLPVHPDHLESALGGLGALGFMGANVTIPHKQAILPFLEKVSPEVKGLGAVNTILVEPNREGGFTYCGENTDVDGFLAGLQSGGFNPSGKRAVITGAGGAARAVAAGLLKSGIQSITIINRNELGARRLVENLDRQGRSGVQIHYCVLNPDNLLEISFSADLLVNATSVGMWPEEGESIWPEKEAIPGNLTVFDLVYNPLETRLIQQARCSGANHISGLDMLVWQGALAFQKWSGMAAPVETMRQACLKVLRR